MLEVLLDPFAFLFFFILVIQGNLFHLIQAKTFHLAGADKS